jgi:peptidylprolyl isomerase
MNINETLKKPKYIILIIALIIVISMAAYVGVNLASVPTVAAGDTVQVYYTGTLVNGTVFDTNVGKEPLNFTVGSNQVIDGFDQAVIGMKLNETKNVTIPANEAYGPVDPSLIIIVPLEKFGNQTVKAGMTVSQETDGEEIEGIVTAVNETNATLDFNPPLAGQTLNFEIKVVSIEKKQ